MCSHLKNLFVLDVGTERADTAPLSHPARVSDVTFARDGKLLACASDDHTISISDTETWRVVNVLKGHLSEVSTVVFSHDDSLLYSGGKDGAIRVWHTSSKAPTSRQIPYDPDWAKKMSMSWDGSAFCAISGRTATVWDVRTGKLVATTELPDLQKKGGELPLAGYLPLAVSGNGRMFATVLDDEGIRLWNVASGEQFTVESLDRVRVSRIEFSPKENALFVLRVDGGLEKVDLATAQTTTMIPPQEGTSPHSISFSENGKRLAIGQVDGRVSTWAFANGKLVRDEWQPHFEVVDRIVYLPDRQTVVTSSRDASIKFWDLFSQTALPSVDPVKNAFFSMDLSKDGSRLAAGTVAGDIKLWDVGSRRQVASLDAGTKGIYRIAFPDENTIACIVLRSGLRVFRAPTWEQIEATEE